MVNKNGNKPRGKPFEKGNKYGQGRPPMSDEEKEVSRLTRNEFRGIVFKYFKLTREEAEEIMADKKTHLINLSVLSVMISALDGGDEKRMNWLLEQSFGKLKEIIDVTSNVTYRPTIDLKKVSSDDLNQLKLIAQKSNTE